MTISDLLEGAKPILFQDEMVRAIERKESPKVVTRRVIKPQPAWGCSVFWSTLSGSWRIEGQTTAVKCSWRKGDVLYVRQAWRELGDGTIDFRSDYEPLKTKRSHKTRKSAGVSWKPSIHLKKNNCRLLLRVTDVRAERLQKMDDSDAVAEGVLDLKSFRDLWDSIHDDDGYEWIKDPWVWVVEFERLVWQ